MNTIIQENSFLFYLFKKADEYDCSRKKLVSNDLDSISLGFNWYQSFVKPLSRIVLKMVGFATNRGTSSMRDNRCKGLPISISGLV
jgi:hypothetical protein